MRAVSIIALAASSLSLAACAAGGGGSALGLASNLPICGVQCGPAQGGGSTGGGTTTPEPDTDGDGTPDDTDTNGGTGSGAGGNGTDLTPATGARTIALESGALVIPSNGGTSLSSLSTTTTTSAAAHAAAAAAIISGSKPTELKLAIDTEGDGNTTWAVPVLMDEYATGTSKPDAFNALPGNVNVGAGSNYREYRALSSSQNRDELLQVWAWDYSYGIQYRNAASGDQAWTYGGTATTAMPTSGTGIYDGRFAATAKTENWDQNDANVNPNALWQVQGDSHLDVDFGTGGVTGTLTPSTWSSYQPDASVTNYTWYTNQYAVDGEGAASIGTTMEPEFSFYGTTIAIDATIDQTTGPTPTNSANFTGEANLSGDFVSGDNPVYGGFFGPTANEVAGVFNVYGIDPSPSGGDDGITDDRRGYLTINGTFNGNCDPASTGCTP